MIKYKGYTAKIEFDDQVNVFHGEVLNIRDVITFQGRTVEELRNAFHDSVEDYLDFCAHRNEPPEKPYSGRFVVRLAPSLHRAIATQARLADKSLNAWIQDILREKVE
jgi:predicted HicB family RNase H-like nuclease